MSESVQITPQSGNDTDGDPIAPGEPIDLVPLEIAPGNMLLKYGAGGDLNDVEFTVYLPLRVKSGETYTDITEVIRDGDEIVVRGRRCTAMVQIWRSQRDGGRGGAAVLARSRSGKAA